MSFYREMAGLSLADGSKICIESKDESAFPIYLEIIKIMQMKQLSDCSVVVHLLSDYTTTDLLSRRKDEIKDGSSHNCNSQMLSFLNHIPSKKEIDVICNLPANLNDDNTYMQIYYFSVVINILILRSGGLLLHGALAQKDSYGVLLVGPSGSGKTTASNRFPKTWKSLSDDSALVVRDASGNYWAHPWPTWSRFVRGGPGGTWDVQRSVPLKAAFLLKQCKEDRAERLKTSESVVPLLQSAMNIARLIFKDREREVSQTIYSQFLDNTCEFARSVPVFELNISLTGEFWNEIEGVIE